MKQKEHNADRKHMTFFLPELAAGGAERVFITISGALAERGHRVDLLLARECGPLLSDVHPKVTIVPLTNCTPGSSSLRLGLQSLWGLSRYLRKQKPDTLFSTLTGANLVAILANMLAGKPTKLFVREASTLANVKSRLRLNLMRFLYPGADGIIALTDFMGQEMTEKLKLHNCNIHIVGNPVDYQRIQKLARQEPISETKRYRPYIVVVGRLSPPKDITTAISALAHLRQTNKSIDLVVVGEGPLRDTLLAHAKDCGVENHVHFVGFQKNPYPWIASAEVFLLSSKWEGYPNVLFEALSLGKPIVATTYDPSIRKLLPKTQKIIMTPKESHKDFSTAISRLLQNAQKNDKDLIITKLEKALEYYESLAIKPVNKN
ncbi:glycosyltransferase [Marinobacter nauticus]|uniref:glycosyltransferase n=1 Tax=Marinobacter nauticus TaxID=2743 RepID=UPI001D194321|nr:glycosyltransferase [Marinobacter nauticus]MCC4270430.1 glycosyltransferase [Marinobacter nauticus]